MTDDYITPPPEAKLISVTRGCDTSFTVRRVDGNETPVNFAPGTAVAVFIDIDKAAPTRVDAMVSGADAAITIPDSVCDQVKTGTRWRAVLDIGDSETPLLVGRFERHDG